MNSFPSEIIEAVITYRGRPVPVKVPQNEARVIRDIFELQEYALPTWYRPAAPLQIWDVGANIGLFSLYIKLIYPQSTVHCFEPVTALSPLFEANTAALTHISLHPYGLFNRDQEATIYLSSVASVLNSLRPLPGHEQGQAAVQLKDAGAEWDRMGVSHLDLLKIDTEGSEIEILESLGRRLDSVDILMIEYHSEADRRLIDHLLPQFSLYGQFTPYLGLGTPRYVHQRLLYQV